MVWSKISGNRILKHLETTRMTLQLFLIKDKSKIRNSTTRKAICKTPILYFFCDIHTMITQEKPSYS